MKNSNFQTTLSKTDETNLKLSFTQGLFEKSLAG